MSWYLSTSPGRRAVRLWLGQNGDISPRLTSQQASTNPDR